MAGRRQVHVIGPSTTFHFILRTIIIVSILHCFHRPITALFLNYCTVSILRNCLYSTALIIYYYTVYILLHSFFITALFLYFCTGSLLLHCLYITALFIYYCTVSI